MACPLLRHYLPTISMSWCFAWNLQLFYLTPMGVLGVSYQKQRENHTLARVVCLNPHSNTDLNIYSQCKTYEGLVTVDDTIASSGVFNIVMTYKSNRHIKIHSCQTMGILHSCEDSEICTIHEIGSFSRNPMVGKDELSNPDTAEGSFYYVPTRNHKTGRLEMNMLPRKDFYSALVNEVGPQHDFVHYRKPSLLHAPVDKHTKDDLEKLLEVNCDPFAEDERQIGTTTPSRCP